MELALAQMPLILFTTLAPMGAGAFIPLFLMYLRSIYNKSSTMRIDQLTLVPILFAAVGFICSLFHLGNPLNALNVLRTVGQTPLANEVVAFIVFLVLAVAYWAIVSIKRYVSPGTRTIMTGIIMIAGLIAVLFMGMAYIVPSIPVWNSSRSVIELVGVWLLGGVSLGSFLIAMADPRDNNAYADELVAKILLGLGGAILIAASISIYMAGAALNSALIDASENANSLFWIQSLAELFILFAIVGAFFGRKQLTRPVFGIVFVLSFIACFLVRFCFYGMQISIGL